MRLTTIGFEIKICIFISFLFWVASTLFHFYSSSFERNWNAERMMLCFYSTLRTGFKSVEKEERNSFFSHLQSKKNAAKFKMLSAVKYEMLFLFRASERKLKKSNANLHYHITIIIVSLWNNKHPANWITSLLLCHS